MVDFGEAAEIVQKKLWEHRLNRVEGFGSGKRGGVSFRVYLKHGKLRNPLKSYVDSLRYLSPMDFKDSSGVDGGYRLSSIHDDGRLTVVEYKRLAVREAIGSYRLMDSVEIDIPKES